MTEARATQAVALVGSIAAWPARVTGVAALYGYPNPSPARATQVAVLAGDMSPRAAWVTQVAVLVGHHWQDCLTRWAQCWKITRADGEVFAFTSLDRDLDFRGLTYKSCASLVAGGAQMFSAPGAAGNLELTGIIADDAIGAADLLGGKFDGAEIEIWMVPWA